jgi:thiosulfate/3-mercaptopyruvate sulfurtransferase
MLRACGCYLLLAAIMAVAVSAGDAKPAKGAPATPADPPAPREFARADALIGTAALLKEIEKGGVILVDARRRREFEAGHLPGAFNIESDAFQDPERLPYYMPAPDVVKKACADAQIRAASRVVIYDEDDGRLAARVWFTLHAYGHERVAILDGGVGKWRAEGRPLAGGAALEVPATGRETFEPLPLPRNVCAFAELPQFRTRVHTLGKLPPTTLLDGRTLQEYMGEEVRGKAGGHIPGAANIEWSAMLVPLALPAPARGEGEQRPGGARVWRSPPEIHAILRMAGAEREQRICVYDQAGGRSSHLYFTLWLMGFDRICNYVAGWREYGNRDDVEIEK